MSNENYHTKLVSILKGCLRGKRKSQRALYELYYAYGMSIALRYSNDREESVEILNDAFMKVFINLEKFDLTKPFKPWFRKILVNCSINRFNANQRRIKEENIEYGEGANTPEDILSGISYDEIVEMVRKLSPAYRTVFNLYVIEGYKHEEIAEMLNISVGTSKSNLSKAKQNLRGILKDFFQEDYAGTK